MTLHLPPEEIIARNKAKQKQWRIDHPERIKSFHNKYNSKPETRERKAAWAREHRDEINARRREIYRLNHASVESSLQVDESTVEEKNI